MPTKETNRRLQEGALSALQSPNKPPAETKVVPVQPEKDPPRDSQK